VFIKILHLTGHIGNMNELSYWYLIQQKQRYPFTAYKNTIHSQTESTINIFWYT